MLIGGAVALGAVTGDEVGMVGVDSGRRGVHPLDQGRADGHDGVDLPIGGVGVLALPRGVQ